jgi:hypothetical protein
MLIILVNGWVDYANNALRNTSYFQAYDAIQIDDYDTLYEWIAEDVFGVEDAIPEQEGDADDSGKIVDVNLVPLGGISSLHVFLLPESIIPWLIFKTEPWENPALNIWDPPPNV